MSRSSECVRNPILRLSFRVFFLWAWMTLVISSALFLMVESERDT